MAVNEPAAPSVGTPADLVARLARRGIAISPEQAVELAAAAQNLQRMKIVVRHAITAPRH